MTDEPVTRTYGSIPIPSNNEAEYVNPAEQWPRWFLSLAVRLLRLAASFGFWLGNHTAQKPPGPSRTIWVDATLSREPGKRLIKVDVWDPASGETGAGAGRPAIINFHGGGYILGQGTDDARWAACTGPALGAVVFCVNYRLAPRHPFPTPAEDCADAVLQICSQAKLHGIDPNRVILSGFSAGGNAILSVWAMLHDPERWGYQLPGPLPRFVGIVGFYPLLDWTPTRPQKRLTTGRPDLTLKPGLTNMIDASYIYPSRSHKERGDLRLSPGLMTDEMIDQLPPLHLCLCEYDMLLAEGQKLAERVRARGKPVTVSVVAKQQHAWDKSPSLKPKDDVIEEYAKAIGTMRDCLQFAN